MSATGRKRHAPKPHAPRSSPEARTVPIPAVNLGPLVPTSRSVKIAKNGVYGQRQTIRDPDDNYATPEWCLEAIWPHVRPASGVILDPCAGSGAVLRFVAARYDKALVNGCELDRERCDTAAGHAWCQHGDWLADDHPRTLRGVWPKLILTNPPYRLALPFIQKAIEMVRPAGGAVCMLLRVNFLASQKRADWMREHTPDVWVLPRRPSFTPDNKTDATEYAWMVWNTQRKGHARVAILAVPEKVRAAR